MAVAVMQPPGHSITLAFSSSSSCSYSAPISSQQPQRRVRLVLVDLREREADVDQDPVAGSGGSAIASKVPDRRPPPSSRPMLTVRRTPATSTVASRLLLVHHLDQLTWNR